jgi:hypothetical protein
MMDRLGNSFVGTTGVLGSIGLGTINHWVGIVAGLATILYMAVATANELSKRKRK